MPCLSELFWSKARQAIVFLNDFDFIGFAPSNNSAKSLYTQIIAQYHATICARKIGDRSPCGLCACFCASKLIVSTFPISRPHRLVANSGPFEQVYGFKMVENRRTRSVRAHWKSELHDRRFN